MEVGLRLQTVGYVFNPKDKFYKLYPSIDGFPDGVSLDIKKEDVETHNCIEEQLWAIRVYGK